MMILGVMMFTPQLHPYLVYYFKTFKRYPAKGQKLTLRTVQLLNKSNWSIECGRPCAAGLLCWAEELMGFGFLSTSVETPWGILPYEIPCNLESHWVGD